MATAKKSREQSDKYGIRWEQDSDTSACRQCEKKFTTLRRRHHCRVSLFFNISILFHNYSIYPPFCWKIFGICFTHRTTSLSLSLSLSRSLRCVVVCIATRVLNGAHN